MSEPRFDGAPVETPRARARGVQAVLLSAGVVLATLGLYFMRMRSDFSLGGVVFLTLSVIVTAWALARRDLRRMLVPGRVSGQALASVGVIEAVYRDGHIVPLAPLDLAPEAALEVRIAVRDAASSPGKAGAGLALHQGWVAAMVVRSRGWLRAGAGRLGPALAGLTRAHATRTRVSMRGSEGAAFPRRGTRPDVVLLVVLALALAALGQYELLIRPEHPTDGIVFFVMAVVTLAGAGQVIRRPIPQ
jgi:hypothetical protein